MTIPELIAQALIDEGARDLVHASEATKAQLTNAYLAARGWDVEVTFNMREFRDAVLQGSTYQNVVMNEIYSWAENVYGPDIEADLQRLRKEKAA